MKPLRELTAADLGGGINAIDLGASGGVKPEWRALAHLINVLGFDPNAQECARLNGLPLGYRSARFLPYALAGETGQATLHRTRNIQCWSLLPPRLSWLRRFAFADLFEPEGTETIPVYRLDAIPELRGIDMDAIKIDTQGLELPILKAGEPILDGCVWVETETGFTDNYEGETTFDQILEYMRGRGFGLFGLDAGHAIPRRNALSGAARNEQILWCEGIWLRDYRRSSPERQRGLTRAKALRALCLYANHGCVAFGLEMAGLFRDLGLVTGNEYDRMAADASWWRLTPEPPPVRRTPLRFLAESLIGLVPRSALGRLRGPLLSLASIVDGASRTRHPFRR